MVLDYKGRDGIDNWQLINYLQYVQSMWGLRTPSMLRAGWPTLLTWRWGGGGGVRFDQAQVVCIPSRTWCGFRLYPFLISVLLSTLQGQEFLVVRGSFSLNAELGEICWHIANRCCTFSFKIPKRISTIKFSRSPRFDIFSFFRHGSWYEALMQSRSFDCLLYVLFFSVIHT